MKQYLFVLLLVILATEIEVKEMSLESKIRDLSLRLGESLYLGAPKEIVCDLEKRLMALYHVRDCSRPEYQARMLGLFLEKFGE